LIRPFGTSPPAPSTPNSSHGIQDAAAHAAARHSTQKNRDQVSKNQRTVIVTWNMKGKADVAKKKIDGIEASVAKVGDQHPGFYVGEAGSVSSGKALDKMFADQ
jgi:hypothetical protein